MGQKTLIFAVGTGIFVGYLSIIGAFAARYNALELEAAEQKKQQLEQQKEQQLPQQAIQVQETDAPTWSQAWLYSVDTITCRGRCPDTSDELKIPTDKIVVAEWESILGHLFLPLSIAALFAAFVPMTQ
jgi:hypothetical protein